MTFTIGGSMARSRDHAAVVTVTGGGAITLGNRYELGIARVKVIPGISSDTFYAHNDHLGTLRAESDVWAAFNTYPVHTAFGEDMTGLGQRHSYVGAFGYQANFDYNALHVGARYYDPASGRFLQRDPIGIGGGLNVYLYVKSIPTYRVDPSGHGEGYDEFSRSVSDRFYGTLDSVVSFASFGLCVNCVSAGPTFNKQNRDNAERTADVIIGVTEAAASVPSLGKLVVRKSRRAAKACGEFAIDLLGQVIGVDLH